MFKPISSNAIQGLTLLWLPAGRVWRLWRARMVSTEQLILGVSLFFSVACNGLFWSVLLTDRDLTRGGSWVRLPATIPP